MSVSKPDPRMPNYNGEMIMSSSAMRRNSDYLSEIDFIAHDHKLEFRCESMRNFGVEVSVEMTVDADAHRITGKGVVWEDREVS